MVKHFCDRCGKEVGVYNGFEFQTWWTVTRHGMLDLTTELCDACYQTKLFEADTTSKGLTDNDDILAQTERETDEID